jgi:hypothetical protein
MTDAKHLEAPRPPASEIDALHIDDAEARQRLGTLIRDIERHSRTRSRAALPRASENG